MLEAREIRVTLDNFARAASDTEFDKYVALAVTSTASTTFASRRRLTTSPRSG